MLRFLILTSLRLLIAFTGIGLLISKAWGWPEYASPELYVVYTVLSVQPPNPFMLTNMAGSYEQSQLTWNKGIIIAAACSPDGRTFAFLTDTAHLYVINQSGIEYDQSLDQNSYVLAVADNGTSAVYGPSAGITVFPLTGKSYFVPQPDSLNYTEVKISSSGFSLWPDDSAGGIKLVSPENKTVFELPQSEGALFPKWLTSEQIFAYAYWDVDTQSQAITDLSSQKTVRFHNHTISFGIFSPDATQEVFDTVDTHYKPQLFSVNALDGENQQQLTHDAGEYQIPICFLTFRPQMLIADTQ